MDMYDNNYPNDYYNNHAGNTNGTVGANGTPANQGGQFSSAAQNTAQSTNSANTNAQGSVTGNTQQNGSAAGTGYGAYHNPYQNTYQNSYQNQAYGHSTAYGSGTGSYQYGNTYPNDYTQMSRKKQKKQKEKKERTGAPYWKKAIAAASLGIFFGVFAGLGFYVVQNVSGPDKTTEVSEATEAVSDAAQSVTETAQSSSQTTLNQSVTTVTSDVSDMVSNVMPSIVSITNHYTETMSYFGQAMTNEADASGSGIIVGQNDTELLIVTNYHVVEGADSLKVQFNEGSEAEAFLKGSDSDMDLAVLAVPMDSIEASTLQQISVATLGDSDSLVVGEPAIAIGNALGYGQSVTTGVISALNRSIELSDGSTGTFIQTDAAINPGNSGGALLNVEGEVIGINSNKIGGSTVEGMGYAIPISAANPIIADLMLKETKSKVAEEERGYLGISGISVTEEVSQAYGMPEGVYIAQVYDNTAASAAGLQKGDIITEFDGDKITSMDDLQKELEFYAKGNTVKVTVMTVQAGGYESKTVEITLGNKVQE